MNTQDWSPPLGWTGWISLQSKGISRVFSNTTVKSINSLALSYKTAGMGMCREPAWGIPPVAKVMRKGAWQKAKAEFRPQGSPWIFLSIYPQNQSLPALLYRAFHSSDITGGYFRPPFSGKS